jgi:hypothetical protein
MIGMEIEDLPTNQALPEVCTTEIPSLPSIKKPWTNDTCLTTVPDDIFNRLQRHQQTIQDAGELDDNPPMYKNPEQIIESHPNLTQRIRFNLIRHRGTICDVPTIKLFKSFTATLHNADSSVVFLPYQASKQHYSSITNLKQIQAVDQSRLLQFFKPYHMKQQYSLSGYFHISSTLTFDQIRSLPSIDEWLDTYNYYIKLCPSQNEEMTQIRALCYSSIFMYREDLMEAILSHPLWTPTDPSKPPIFDLFISDFISNGKKEKNDICFC